eukprot:5986124-Amphidinium_carterae.1
MGVLSEPHRAGSEAHTFAHPKSSAMMVMMWGRLAADAKERLARIAIVARSMAVKRRICAGKWLLCQDATSTRRKVQNRTTAIQPTMLTYYHGKQILK